MEDPFDFRELRVQQPGKLLADRAKYEIFNAERQLLATAAETEGHTLLKLLSKSMPDTRVLTVVTADGEPVLALIKHASEWITELRDPEGGLIGRIRTGDTRRIYTLLDGQDKIVGKVTGDLALRHYSATGTRRHEFARIRKTWAGLAKEMLTPSDHYLMEFTGPVSQPGPDPDRNDAYRAGPDLVRADLTGIARVPGGCSASPSHRSWLRVDEET